jgi:hypothetical protein
MKLSAKSFSLLLQIDEYIREYDIRGRWLPSAASDVLDGSVHNPEIADLFRLRLITRIIDQPPLQECDECGDSWTVHLTDKAIAIFWPERNDNETELHGYQH